jgi:hypothetical protein
MDLVAPLTEEEQTLYGNISYSMDNLHESLGAETGIHPTKERTLMARWRYPSLSIHGIEGACVLAVKLGKLGLDMVEDQLVHILALHVRHGTDREFTNNLGGDDRLGTRGGGSTPHTFRDSWISWLL